MLRDVIISFCEKILLCFIFVNSACFLCGGVGVYMSLKENMCKMCGISYRRGLYCCSFSSIGHFSRPQSVDRTTDGSRFFMPLSCRNSSDQQKNNGDWLRQSLSAPCLLPVRALVEFNRTRGYRPTYWLKPDCVQTEDLVSSLKLLSPGICIDGIAACCSSVILVRNNSFPL